MSEETERPRIIYLFGPEDDTLWCVDDNSDEEFPATTYIVKSNYDQLASIARDMAGALGALHRENVRHLRMDLGEEPHGPLYDRVCAALSRYTAFMEGEE